MNQQDPNYTLDPDSIQTHTSMLDEQELEQLKNKAIEYHNLCQQHKKQDFFSYQQYYIVSLKWLERWKVFCSYNEITKNKDPNKYFGVGELPTLNQDIVNKQYKSDINFTQDLAHYNVKLNPGLQEGKDYVFMTYDMWKIFRSSYKNIEVQRFVVQTPTGNKVQLYYQKITFAPISIAILKDIQHERRTTLITVTFQFSHYAQIYDVLQSLKPYIKNFLTYDHVYQLRKGFTSKIWLSAQNTQKHNLFHTLRQGCGANSTYSYKLYIDGKRITQDTKIIDVQILDDSILVVQMKTSGDDWMFFNKDEYLVSKCQNCKDVDQLKYLCSCKCAAYCSKKCKIQHKSLHENRCPNNAESQSQEQELRLTQNSKRGVVGLRNLGNTCFMNSGLQCISHVYDLTKYFLEDKYVKDINKENVLGTQGELCMAFAKMLKNLWFSSDSSFSPTQVKRAIGKFQPMFSGYDQHDSGQLITYLLDGLHQDLNRIKKKPYVQSKQYDGRPDQIIAREQWNNFLLRNQSQIIDNMYGQYRSVVDCPKCQYRSIQFDPFCMCSLPIINSSLKKLQITYVQNHLLMKKMDITYEKSWNWRMTDVIQQIKKKINKQQARMVIYISSYSSCEIVNPHRLADQVRKQYKYSKIYIRQLQDQQQPENQDQTISLFLGNTTIHSFYKDETYRRRLSPYRLYFFNKNITLKELHHKIFKYYQEVQPQDYKISDIEYQECVINQQTNQQPLRLLAIPTSRYRKCQFCHEKGCQGCNIPYSEQITLQEYVKQCHYDKIQFEIYWRRDSDGMQKRFDEFGDGKGGDSDMMKTGETSLSDCFKLFEETQTLAQDNAWYCPKCKDFVLGRKQMQIYKAPKILVLCLKRFKRKQYYQEKYNILIDFPIENLDMSPYVIHSELPSGHIEEADHKIMDSEGPLLYDLFAISNHFGGTGGGHYTAYCKNPISGQWYDFDDSYVRQINKKSQLISQCAYILFYKRKN